ncbi:O-antigen ligase family protein [uncultured Aquimarina sp.]|uniref:O-antigen ligase family protein n=1 Tax=uncultured Aquimarina sp. TaxID=575652 RepID=UPI0026087289|nr:O-antigen ligase family protein [uncultured Aquimarina sp.]
MKKAVLLKTYLVIFCLLVFSIPFSGIATSLPNILLIALGVLFPFCFRKEQLKELKNPTLLLYLGLVLYVSIDIVTQGFLISDISQLGKLYMPICLLIASFPINKEIKYVQISLIVGVFFIVFASLISLVFYVFEQGEFSFSSGGFINKVLLLERVYIAFLCVLSLIFSLHLLGLSNDKKRKLLIINSIIVISFVFIIAARIAIVSIVFIAIYYMFGLFNKKKILYVIGVSSILIGLFFLANKNLRNRFFYTDQNNSFIENLKIWEPRMVIWPCVYDIVNTESFSFYTGIGSYKNTRLELLDCYDNTIQHPEKKKWFLHIKYNTHNQFLDFLLVSGFLGFLCFGMMFFSALWNGKNSFLKISLVLAFVLLGFVENYLHRQVGVYCFAIFLIMLRNFDSNEVIKNE